jgi:hypothetical protein
MQRDDSALARQILRALFARLPGDQHSAGNPVYR